MGSTGIKIRFSKVKFCHQDSWPWVTPLTTSDVHELGIKLKLEKWSSRKHFRKLNWFSQTRKKFNFTKSSTKNSMKNFFQIENCLICTSFWNIWSIYSESLGFTYIITRKKFCSNSTFKGVGVDSKTVTIRKKTKIGHSSRDTCLTIFSIRYSESASKTTPLHKFWASSNKLQLFWFYLPEVPAKISVKN